MKTVDQVFSRVSTQAESIKCDDDRTIEVMDIGDEVRQGDIYITRIDRNKAGELVKAKLDGGQLAPGTTQGSRHTVRDLKDVRVFRLATPGPLDGPILESESPIGIDHPEHGNRVVPPGCYAVTYQRAYGEELRRVAD